MIDTLSSVWRERMIRPKSTEIQYPDSDGQPMADNTLQFNWIMTIQGGLDLLFENDPNVFVAGDLLWYPVEGNNKIRVAPDAMVIFGRPKGYRGSYRQWVEDDITPQVVFEILSPGNTTPEMLRKLHFYGRFGVQEYYLYDPDKNEISGWIRRGEKLLEIDANLFVDGLGWTSPQLDVTLKLTADTLELIRPDGIAFLSYVALGIQLKQAQLRADEEQARADEEQARAEKMAAKLRAMGIDPSDL